MGAKTVPLATRRAPGPYLRIRNDTNQKHADHLTHLSIDARCRCAGRRRPGRGSGPRRPQRRDEGLYSRAVDVRQSRRDRLRQGQRGLLRRRHRERCRCWWGDLSGNARQTVGRGIHPWRSRQRSDRHEGLPGEVVRGRWFLRHGHCLRHRDQAGDGLVRKLRRGHAQRPRGHKTWRGLRHRLFPSHVVAHHAGAGRGGGWHAGGHSGRPGDQLRVRSAPLQPQWHRRAQGRPLTRS